MWEVIMRTAFGLIALSSLVGVGLAAGCGSSGSSPSDGGVATSRKLTSLSDSEVGSFCDQLAAIEGGYNHEKTLTCGDDAGGSVTVTLMSDIGANQTECKVQFKSQLPPACSNLTVGDITVCVTDIYAETCATSNDDPASCHNLFTCLFGP
jgi:hypothetical protein